MTERPQSEYLQGGDPLVITSAEPDWAALAERHERDSRRRRRLRLLAAGAAATAVVVGITATAIVVSGGSDHRAGGATTGVVDALGGRGPSPAGSPTTDGAASPGTSASSSPNASPSGAASGAASASPAPGRSASADVAHPSAGSAAPAGPATTLPDAVTPTPGAAPKDPLTLISNISTDGAPLDPATLFAATTLSADGKTWTRIDTGTASPCWQKTTGGLGQLTAEGCGSLLLATYTNGFSAVTIGVAVFDTKSLADAAAAAYKGQIQGLAPAGSISFCTSPSCANTHGSIGRYDFYSVSGTRRPGTTGTTADPDATAAGPTLAAYASSQLLARGKTAAG
ncbi:hypothetical protein [Kitasatospora mediocidica]|uniref:hypothetical protein n=1 Tax=Kitasatospora mediocidica TaxID=58352 RepID=UPI00056A71DD|nr:hypothetical protein [Kitasatospora mediocidica]